MMIPPLLIVMLHRHVLRDDCAYWMQGNGDVLSQVSGELELVRVLCNERGQVVVIQAHFLAFPQILVRDCFLGHPTYEVLGCLCHDQRGLRRHGRHPAREKTQSNADESELEGRD